MKPRIRPASCIFLLLTAVAPLFAQTGQDLDRSQLFRPAPGVPAAQQANESAEALGYAAPTANDQDLGVQAILKQQQEYKPFTFSLSTPVYFTSNVALTRNGEKGDAVFAPLLTLAYQPHLTRTLYGEFLVSQQLFYYSRYGEFNFTSLDLIAGLVWYLPQYHDLTLRARYDYNRLTTDDFDEFFQNHSLVFSAELPVRFGRAMQVTLGTVADISLAADPQEPRRNEFHFYADYGVQLSRSFTVDAAVRVLLKDYTTSDRTDVSEIFSLSANYRVREWVALNAVASFAANQSNHSVFDYQVANVGGAIGVAVKF